MRFLQLFNYPSKNLEVRYHYNEVLQEIWYPQGIELVEALILLISRCCAAVINAQGGWTKYQANKRTRL